MEDVKSYPAAPSGECGLWGLTGQQDESLFLTAPF